MAFMQQIPPSVYLTLQKYMPEEYGFGVRPFGKKGEFEWGATKNIDAIVKLFDYLLPQLLIAAKVLAAAALLVGHTIAPEKSTEFANALSSMTAEADSPEADYMSQKNVIELTKDQAYYLKVQILRGVVAAVAGPVGLLFADAIETVCLQENAPLLKTYNENVPEFFRIRA